MAISHRMILLPAHSPTSVPKSTSTPQFSSHRRHPLHQHLGVFFGASRCESPNRPLRSPYPRPQTKGSTRGHQQGRAECPSHRRRVRSPFGRSDASRRRLGVSRRAAWTQVSEVTPLLTTARSALKLSTRKSRLIHLSDAGFRALTFVGTTSKSLTWSTARKGYPFMEICKCPV
jgi:hypothetical protein